MTTPKKSKAKVNSNNTTGYHGVTKSKNGKFVAQINFKEEGAGKRGRKTVKLGEFSKAIEAAKAYDEAAVKYHGEKAKLNFPK